MEKFQVWIGSVSFGVIKAANEQDACDEAARLAGYIDEDDMARKIGYPPDIKAIPV